MLGWPDSLRTVKRAVFQKGFPKGHLGNYANLLSCQVLDEIDTTLVSDAVFTLKMTQVTV